MATENNLGNHYLCLIRSDEDKKSLKLNAIKKISQEKLENIKDDDKVIRDYFHSKNVLDSVLANRDDVINAIIQTGNAYASRIDTVEQLMDDALFDISRLIANTCSLFRSFLDHSDRSLQKILAKSLQNIILGSPY